MLRKEARSIMIMCACVLHGCVSRYASIQLAKEMGRNEMAFVIFRPPPAATQMVRCVYSVFQTWTIYILKC